MAWFHGAPGKDQWTRVEKVVLATNLLGVIGLLLLFEPPVEATELTSVVDEKGNQQLVEVAKSGFHQRVIVFFWDNESGDEALDWLGYGLPWMLTRDLDRSSPLLSARSLFDSHGLTGAVTERGFDRARGEPMALREIGESS